MAGPASTSRLPVLRPSVVRTAHRTVTDRLREAILSGELPGGTRLVQSELAASLAVSVTPVREALRDLVGEGLIEFDPYRGATVHEPTLDELEEIYELRSMLTARTVSEGVQRISDDQLDLAESLHKSMKTQSDPALWLDLNRQFHHVLDAASGRPLYQDFLGRLADLSALYVGVSISGSRSRRKQANADHAEMIAAYRARDPERAVELALRHLGDTVEVARARLMSTPDI
ncbi:MAG: GntR family transcriptional regulator [Actinomycetota bacterium]|nr:GntR family transcriptional regulator [Actinomycetota bacterium]